MSLKVLTVVKLSLKNNYINKKIFSHIYICINSIFYTILILIIYIEKNLWLFDDDFLKIMFFKNESLKWIINCL